MSKFQPNANGMFFIRTGLGSMMETPITPIDKSSMKTWADSLVQRGLSVINHGFGKCHDGSDYDLNNFLADTCAGDVPWNEPQFNEMFNHMLEHPQFNQVMDEFEAKYGVEYFPRTLEECQA